tara:strand:- start:168715 stop:169947 length:1233 start_codon:yes stop_codon:yes gene_type:complete
MKKLLLSATLLATTIATAQETVNISMGAGYKDEVYVNLENVTENTYEAASWDIAFLRNDPQNIGIRVNDGIGIQVYEAANTPAGFNTIDIANEASWTPLYNDDTNWDNGAFMQGSATFGWGEYNPVTHHVEGTIVFVLKFADGTYVKFLNEEYFGGYTFKYATWNGTAWVGETTETVENTSNPDNRYNYYSIQNNEEVVAEPAVDAWDFVFTKYSTFLDPPGSYYIVTGVLHNPTVTVAQNEETAGPGDPDDQTYLEEINTIGYDWKSFNVSDYDVNSDLAYYVKRADNSVYRLVFTEFEGATTGDLTFEFENVSEQLGFETIAESGSFGIYPNPTVNGEVTLVYDLATTSAKNTVEIYAINGTKVLSEALTSQEGFYTKTLDVSALQSGVYVVHFISGNNSISKKLIVK